MGPTSLDGSLNLSTWVLPRDGKVLAPQNVPLRRSRRSRRDWLQASPGLCPALTGPNSGAKLSPNTLVLPDPHIPCRPGAAQESGPALVRGGRGEESMSPIEALPEVDGGVCFKRGTLPWSEKCHPPPSPPSNPHPLSSCLTSDSAWLPTTYISSPSSAVGH